MPQSFVAGLFLDRHARLARRRGGRDRTAAILAVTLAIVCAALSAEAQFLTPVSVAQDGGAADNDSVAGDISANGRFVVFSSRASNLVPGDTNGVEDTFVRDLQTNTTERISVTSTGAQATAASGPGKITGVGDVVIFTSTAALVPEDTVPCGPSGAGCTDLYAYDRATHTTTLLTRGFDGTPANDASLAFDIDHDASRIVFVSYASNLVPDDTNGQADVFVVERATLAIRRVSVGPNGEQGTGASGPGVAMSDDGVNILFSSTSNLTQVPECEQNRCTNIFGVAAAAPNELRRLPLTIPGSRPSDTLLALDLHGEIAAIRACVHEGRTEVSRCEIWRHNVWNGTTSTVAGGNAGIDNRFGERLSLSIDGRYVAYGSPLQPDAALYDHRTALDGALTDRTAPAGFTTDSRYLLVTMADNPGPGLPGRYLVFRYTIDADDDGLTNVWEAAFGFNPNDPADAAQDADGDGFTTLQESLDGSHPRGTHARHFAEGVANDFFRTQFAFLNPTATEATVVMRLFGESAQVRSIVLKVPARGRRTFTLPDAPFVVEAFGRLVRWPEGLSRTPGPSFSAIVESDQQVVVDRLTTWGQSSSPPHHGYGSSLETSIDAPATTWHFAEGATGNGFSLYYLLSNPGAVDASVAVDYLRPDGLPVLSENVPVAAHSRVTVDVASRFPALLTGTVSGRLTSTQPIVAERAMYRTTATQFFAAGHAGAGIVTPAPRWFLAEGATGFFDEYVLVSNPGATMTNVRFTFLPESGESFSVTREVAANSRFTLDVKEFPALASAAVSIIAESVEQRPIVVERVMWWPAGGEWYEASLSAGVTSTGTRWAIAEGSVAPQEFTYVLVANTDPARAGQAKITLLYENGETRETTLDVPRNGRATLDVGSLPNLPAGPFGIIVEGIDNLPIVVERSLYQTVDGVLFAAGATSVATNITPVP